MSHDRPSFSHKTGQLLFNKAFCVEPFLIQVEQRTWYLALFIFSTWWIMDACTVATAPYSSSLFIITLCRWSVDEVSMNYSFSDFLLRLTHGDVPFVTYCLTTTLGWRDWSMKVLPLRIKTAMDGTPSAREEKEPRKRAEKKSRERVRLFF